MAEGQQVSAGGSERGGGVGFLVIGVTTLIQSKGSSSSLSPLLLRTGSVTLRLWQVRMQEMNSPHWTGVHTQEWGEVRGHRLASETLRLRSRLQSLVVE